MKIKHADSKYAIIVVQPIVHRCDDMNKDLK